MCFSDGGGLGVGGCAGTARRARCPLRRDASSAAGGRPVLSLAAGANGAPGGACAEAGGGRCSWRVIRTPRPGAWFTGSSPGALAGRRGLWMGPGGRRGMRRLARGCQVTTSCARRICRSRRRRRGGRGEWVTRRKARRRRRGIAGAGRRFFDRARRGRGRARGAGVRWQAGAGACTCAQARRVSRRGSG